MTREGAVPAQPSVSPDCPSCPSGGRAQRDESECCESRAGKWIWTEAKPRQESCVAEPAGKSRLPPFLSLCMRMTNDTLADAVPGHFILLLVV